MVKKFNHIQITIVLLLSQILNVFAIKVEFCMEFKLRRWKFGHNITQFSTLYNCEFFTFI